MSDEKLDVRIMNRELVEKLKLLNYEANFSRIKGHKPLSKTYFVQKNGHGGEQNVYFNALASWLVNQCGGNISGDKKYDDPVTMATNILTEMKNAGIDCDIPPNQLRTGYGIPVCTVLLLLANRALEKAGFSFNPPKFEDKKSRSGGNEAPEIEDEIPESINAEIDYGDSGNKEDKEESKNKNSSGEDSGTGILKSEIPPEDWQRELEKVSSKLKLDYKTYNSYNNSEWRGHVQQIKEGSEKFTVTIPDSRAILENLSSEIDKSLEKIIKKEEILSKNHENIISNYKEKHKAGGNQFDEYKKLNETVDELRREADETVDKINETNEKYDALSRQISDTTKLGNTKKAIESLSNENITLDMKINILNHSLLKYTLDSDIMKLINNTSENVPVNDTSMYEEVL